MSDKLENSNSKVSELNLEQVNKKVRKLLGGLRDLQIDNASNLAKVIIQRMHRDAGIANDQSHMPKKTPAQQAEVGSTEAV